MSESPPLPSLRPTAEELLDAVREHLMQRVLPTLSDQTLRFQTLVAAHVLGVVSREMQGGHAARAIVTRERQSLLGEEGDEAALCAAIRAGRFDAPEAAAQLRAHLTHRTELALLAWNPAFLTRVKADPAG